MQKIHTQMEAIVKFRDLFIQKYGDEHIESVDSAISIAVKAFENKYRYNNDPFVYHSIGVARIMVSDLQVGITSIIAALLHDVVRVDPHRLVEIEEKFGFAVKSTLMGMNNISSVETKNDVTQAGHFKELIVSYSTNPRIILLKLADRLEVMQSLEWFPDASREKKAWETLHIYSQIAHKLGLYHIKGQMEELSLKYLEPLEYEHIENKLKENELIQLDFIEKFCSPIRKKLDSQNIKYEIKGRTKSIFSIWQKMRKQKIAFEDIYDLSAIRIIIDTDLDSEKAMCWLCFSIVTDFYKPNPKRMRDWVSIPKSNGYESLHATVVADNGKWVEVQIRTQRMDDLAECGIAAHWRYKGVKDEQAWLERLREVIESVKIDGNTLALDSEIGASTKEVFVFTPNGDLKRLSYGSTVLDFAYDIHSDLGNKCVGGKINSMNVNIREVLKNGDLIEIKTSKTQQPKSDWLNYVVTSKAKNRIKVFLREQSLKQTNVIKDELERKIKNWKLIIPFDEAVNILCRYYKARNSVELYSQLEKNEISMLEAKDILTKFINGELSLRITEEKAPKEKKNFSSLDDEILLIDNNISNIKYNFAKCCNPIYGDDIKGFITVLSGITIHQSDCLNLKHLESRYPYRIMEASWTKDQVSKTFMAKVGLYTNASANIGDDIRAIAKDLNVVIRGVKSTLQGKNNYWEVQLEIPNKNVLNSVEYLFRNISGVARIVKL